MVRRLRQARKREQPAVSTAAFQKGRLRWGKKVKPPKRVKGLAQEEKGRKGTRGGQKAAEQTAKTGAGSALSVDFLEELAESV